LGVKAVILHKFVSTINDYDLYSLIVLSFLHHPIMTNSSLIHQAVTITKPIVLGSTSLQ